MKPSGPLPRYAALRRGAPPQRKTWMNTVNRERRARRKREGRVYGPTHRSMADLPCKLTKAGNCWGPVAGHHRKTVGSGGEDQTNETPLCAGHHDELHTTGPSKFAARYGVDVGELAPDAVQYKLRGEL